MSSNSELLNKVRNEANAAFDAHCREWDLLQKLSSPTIEDLAAWLTARDSLIKAQAAFEKMIHQISTE